MFLKKQLVIGIIISSVFILSGCIPPDDEIIITADPTINNKITGEEIIFVRDQQIFITDSEVENEVQLTENEFNNYAPSWLPGYEEIIYLSQEDEYTKLWKLNLVNREQELITATKDQPNYLAVNVQASYLLYLQNNALFLLDLQTHTTQKIGENITFPVWGPAGDSFAYLQDQTLKYVQFDKYGALAPVQELQNGNFFAPQFIDDQEMMIIQKLEDYFALVRIDLETTQTISEITQFETEQMDQVLLRKAPDKEHVLFSYVPSLETMEGKSYIIELKKGEQTELVNSGFDYLWHADQKHLYFQANEFDESNTLSRNLYQVNLQGKKKKEVLKDVQEVVFSNYLNSNTLAE